MPEIEVDYITIEKGKPVVVDDVGRKWALDPKSQEVNSGNLSGILTEEDTIIYLEEQDEIQEKE